MSTPNSATVPPAQSLWQTVKKGSKTYDLLAASPLILWYAINLSGQLQVLRGFTAKLLIHPDVPLCLTILSRIGVILFASAAIGMLVLRRPPQDSAQGLLPRIATLLGTYLSVGIILLPPANLSPLWLGISAFLTFGGMAFSCYSLLWLGRSFSLMAEARRLVTSGPYSVLRHPLYVGEEISVIGILIQFFSPFAVWLIGIQIACQFYRMHCEEEILASNFPEYIEYKARTARLIPGLY